MHFQNRHSKYVGYRLNMAKQTFL